MNTALGNNNFSNEDWNFLAFVNIVRTHIMLLLEVNQFPTSNSYEN
jgi:hypothetical protein